MNAEERIKCVADAAEETFWARVAELYPECRSGDFPPDVAQWFSNECRNAIGLWVELNRPAQR